MRRRCCCNAEQSNTSLAHTEDPRRLAACPYLRLWLRLRLLQALMSEICEDPQAAGMKLHEGVAQVGAQAEWDEHQVGASQELLQRQGQAGG